MKQGPRPPGELFWFALQNWTGISCSLRSADKTFRPSAHVCLVFIHVLNQKKKEKEIGKQMNETSQCWRAQTQKHRLCQQHTFAMVSSVITDWLAVINNSYWACDVPSDPIRDEELLIHKRDGSSCDEQPTKGRYWTLLMADHLSTELHVSAVCMCVFFCLF